MCGISGIWDASLTNRDELSALSTGMIRTLQHRGPDAEKVWIDPENGISLGHRRLSIIDLTDDGSQPMHSSCGRYVIVFNGEIYNYLELKKDLANLGITFRGKSDTEVMLAAFSIWGIKASLLKFNGMFAFALWDVYEKKLYLGRDRLGKKPLYYGMQRGRFLFGSELKAIMSVPGISLEISEEAKSAFFGIGFIPGDLTIFSGIKKLPPGHLLEVPGLGHLHAPEAYWSFQLMAESTSYNCISMESATDRLNELLKNSVKIRCRSDVPLGAFLSGGIDSSLVVALMKQAGTNPLKTFNIAFGEKDYDESQTSLAVAEFLGAQHQSIIFSSSDVAAFLPKLPEIYDEPFADVSQIPTIMVSEMAREHVKVCLSGDGGDEFFGGYRRHFFAERYWTLISTIPMPVRRFVLQVIRSNQYVRGGVLSRLSRWFGGPAGQDSKSLQAVEAKSLEELYFILTSHGQSQETYSSHKYLSKLVAPLGAGHGRSMMAMDIQCYLPDDVLVKVDRASMASGLEVRSPLLDHRVLEFAWSLPDSLLMSDGQGKKILRTLLKRYLPANMVDYPKKGFSVPISEWLKLEIKPWAESVLFDTSKIHMESDRAMVERRWHDHQSGLADNGHWLWRKLMWIAWKERWGV